MPNTVKPLTFTEEQFLLEYMDCDNYAEAARRVGISYPDALLLSDRKIFKQEVMRLKTTVLGRAEVTAQRVIDEIANIAFFNSQDLLNSDGSMKPIHELPEHVARAVVGLKCTTRDGEKYFTTVVEPKLGDKLRACELLGKTSQLKMFTEVVETKDMSKPSASQVDLDERIKLMGESRDPSLIEPE